jgi:hypothetical protein
MARKAIVLNHPTLKVATTQAGIATGQSVECQIISATLTPQPKYTTIPATGCAGESQSPGLTGWELDLTWLQDWAATAAQSLSQFAYDNDGLPVWYELTLDSIGLAGFKAAGSAYCASGAVGGTFGDGSAAQSGNVVWPCVAKPTITPPTTFAADAADVEQLADADPAMV